MFYTLLLSYRPLISQFLHCDNVSLFSHNRSLESYKDILKKKPSILTTKYNHFLHKNINPQNNWLNWTFRTIFKK